MNISFDPDTVERFLNGEPITKEYSFFTEENCEELEVYLATLLRSVALEFLLEILFTIVNELLVNAYKANSKRIFFLRENKDINDPLVYENLLPRFRSDFGEFREELKKELSESEYKIQFTIQNQSDKLTFRIINNAPILSQERERIEVRIKSSDKIRNLSEAYMENLDTMESSGLGIVLVKLLLKNSGILDNNFQVESEGGITKAYFEIPKIVLPYETKKKIQSVIDDKIQRIPAFPENASKILKAIKSPGINIAWVSELIEREPGLAIEVLKLANSPIYLSRDKISNLKDAIGRVGLQQLEQILYAIGMKESFRPFVMKIESIWEHSIRTGFYTKKILQLKKIPANINIASTGGLIHDLGRMALATLEKPVLKILDSLRVDKLMNHSEFIEEISLGTSHMEIGAILGKKWNFPQELIDILQYHHRPWLYEGDFKNEIEAIYIADFLANLKRKPMNYAIMDPRILMKFGFIKLEEMEEFEFILSKSFGSYMGES